MPHYFLCRTFPQRSEFEVQKVLKLLPQRSENITLCPVGCCIWDGGCCFWDGKQPSPGDPESFWISGQEDFSVVTGPEGTAGSCVRGGHQGWTLGQGAFLQRMSQAQEPGWNCWGVPCSSWASTLPDAAIPWLSSSRAVPAPPAVWALPASEDTPVVLQP